MARSAGIGVGIEKCTEHDRSQPVDRDWLGCALSNGPRNGLFSPLLNALIPAGCLALRAEIAAEDGAAELAEILRRPRDAPRRIERASRREALDQNAVGGEEIDEAERGNGRHVPAVSQQKGADMFRLNWGLSLAAVIGLFGCAGSASAQDLNETHPIRPAVPIDNPINAHAASHQFTLPHEAGDLRTAPMGPDHNFHGSDTIARQFTSAFYAHSEFKRGTLLLSHTDAIKWRSILPAIVSLKKLKAEHVPQPYYPFTLGDILRTVNVDLRRRRARRCPDSAAS
jgi:hypothetical protein